MILNITGQTFEYEGKKYEIGAEIIGTDKSEYEGLFGVITEIRDGEDKDSENETPDLYCAFETPALPFDVNRLEGIFSKLYDKPKTLDDIILDEVIMAPEMVIPLSELFQGRTKKMVFVVLEEWAVNDEIGSTVQVFTQEDEAKITLRKKVRDEKSTGCLHDWGGQDDFVEESDGMSYSGYLDGYYNTDHYDITILQLPLAISQQFASGINDAANADKVEGVSK